jgi:arginyl-tRNA synthetase
MATTRDLIRRRVEAALERAQAAGRLPAAAPAAEASFEIVRPANPEHGDFAANLALKMAAAMKQPPRQVAEALLAELDASPDDPLLARAEVAGPGFLNLWLAARHVEGSVDTIRGLGEQYGRTQVEKSQKINVEFVSANPTGPLHIGNARGAFVGDLLCRVLSAVGHDVTREYYFNDAGRQVELLGQSVAAIKLGQEPPEDGYHGGYVVELGRQLPDEIWARATESGADRDLVLGTWASDRIRAGIEASLERLGVRFDVWTSEQTLVDDGWVARGVERVRSAGHAYEQDGALWFRSTAFGDDKDRVIFRSNGEPTYFAKDIGYLTHKFEREFDELVYIWGADHHGTIARLRNAAEALGFDPQRVVVLLIAWVRFVRDGQEMSMSKRSGEFITLDELLSEVGVDAARWFFASRAPSTGIDFDIELARKQSNENPVYYVQYAHARISSILRKAAGEGLTAAESVVGGLADDPVSLGLAKELLRLPDVVRDAADARETQAITTYVTGLATTFHAFYRDRRVVDSSDPEASGVRLALVDATRATIASALGLLGISAPDSM